MRAVLDTSVLIAAFFSETGASRALVRHAQARTFRLVLSPAILAEADRNLRRLGVAERAVTRYLRVLRSFSVLIKPSAIPAVIRERPADDAILACATEGRADILVTLGRRHLLPRKSHRGIPIVLPGDVLRTLPALPER